jgi:hypothetical protein
VLLQQACKEIEVLVAAALQLVEQRGGGDGATGGGRSVGAGKRKARAAAGGQDVEEWDPEQVRRHGTAWKVHRRSCAQ